MTKTNQIRFFSDTAAISLSILCTIHCLFLPIVLVLLPTTAAMALEGEAFHQSILLLVLPTSALALFIGCKQHKNYFVAISGIAGVLILLLAGTVLEHAMSETSEKIATLIGAGLISLSHCWNYRLCRHQHSDDCNCAAHRKQSN
ncbi:hypothetical protein AB833_06015 [Chromatiales bacterium (ex Bugula neritina AB1)]|nr:hypothetical protein AB833_06015 [Chromatiales bacterium (ex Bugula neritina AB1)]